MCRELQGCQHLTTKVPGPTLILVYNRLEDDGLDVFYGLIDRVNFERKTSMHPSATTLEIRLQRHVASLRITPLRFSKDFFCVFFN